MVYSISITAATKDEARAAVAAEHARVVTGATEHGHEGEAVLAAVDAFLQLAREPREGEAVIVNLRGAIGGDPFAGCSNIAAMIDVTVGTPVQTA